MLKIEKKNRMLGGLIIEKIGLQIKDCEREYYRNPSNRKAQKSGEPIDIEKMSDLLFERWQTLEECLEIAEQIAGLPLSKKVCIGSVDADEGIEDSLDPRYNGELY